MPRSRSGVGLVTLDDVRRLAGVRSESGRLLSVYLNVDGREHPRRGNYEVHLDGLLRAARAKEAHEADIEAVSGYVRAGLDRSETRALALFSCHQTGFWQAFHLPRPTRDQVAVGSSPMVSPLEALLDDYEHFAVVLVDRARARMFRFYLGLIEERTEWVDMVTGQHEQGGRSQARFARHVDDEVHKHLKRTAEQALRMLEAQPFDRLLVGGPEEVVAELERMLHSYLSTRLAGRISVSMADPVETVRQAVLAAEERIERAAETVVVTRLRSAVGRKNGGVTGLEPVLDALTQRRTDVLVVSRDFRQAGWRCGACRAWATVGPTCRTCQGPMAKVEDLVEEAIEEAIAQSVHVEMVTGDADLDVMGRIGAILRY